MALSIFEKIGRYFHLSESELSFYPKQLNLSIYALEKIDDVISKFRRINLVQNMQNIISLVVYQCIHFFRITYRGTQKN